MGQAWARLRRMWADQAEIIAQFQSGLRLQSSSQPTVIPQVTQHQTVYI